jgi:hypothetical protein
LSRPGPASLSVDRALGDERRGARWSVAALVAGLAGFAGVKELARRQQHAVATPEAVTEHQEPLAA